VRFDGRPTAVRGGRDFAGPSALDRYYRVADGWLRLQAPDAASLRGAGFLPDTSWPESDLELRQALMRTFETLSLVEALERLAAAGIPAAPAQTPAELAADPSLRELHLFGTHHLQDGTPYFATKRYARFSRTEEQRAFEAPGLGEHSRDVLAEAGLPSLEIDQLIEAGVVKQGKPFQVVSIQSYR
jgi:crotonobetainyl-CoA:carnitine CoA-transferase CaiB-like acyl-CoA transferase